MTTVLSHTEKFTNCTMKSSNRQFFNYVYGHDTHLHGTEFQKKSSGHISFYLKSQRYVCVCVCVSPSIFYTVSCLLSFAFILLTLLSSISVPGDTYNHALLNYNIVKSRMLWGKITKAQLVHTHSYNLYAETAHICSIWVNPLRREGRQRKER